MAMPCACRFVVLAFSLVWSISYAGTALVATASIKGSIQVKSWKSMRDDRVVKQNLDYSCGAASLATILHEFYGVNATEKAILDRMEKDGAASFADLAKVANEYGFRTQGVALSFEKLRTLKIPAIAYLKYRGDDHFSVIRGIGVDGRVWLGDPSLGNRQFSAVQFKTMWQTRDEARLKGKILLIVPRDTLSANLDRRFFHSPGKQESLAIELLGFRSL